MFFSTGYKGICERDSCQGNLEKGRVFFFTFFLLQVKCDLDKWYRLKLALTTHHLVFVELRFSRSVVPIFQQTACYLRS